MSLTEGANIPQLRIASILLTVAGCGVSVWHQLVLKKTKENNSYDAKTVAAPVSSAQPDKSTFAETVENALNNGELIFPIASHTAMIAMMSYIISNLILVWTPPGEAVCQIFQRLVVASYVVHKSGLYVYLFVRARVTAHVVSRNYFRFVVAVAAIGMPLVTVVAMFLRREVIRGVCLVPSLIGLLSTGLVFLLMDLIVGISLIVMFFRALMQWFQCGDETNPITRSIQWLAFWSVVAVLSTLLGVVVGISNGAIAWYTIQIDAIVNCIAINAQYQIFSTGETTEAIMIASASTKDVEHMHFSSRKAHVPMENEGSVERAAQS